MNILIVTPYYWPEHFRINDVAAALAHRGHHVEVLTGLPNYPSGRFFEGFGLSGPYREVHQGIRLWRVPVVPRGDASALRLLLNYLSFAVAAGARALTLGGRRWDVSLVFQISPVTSIFPAAVLRAAFRTPIVTWVQDLWPEVVASSGLARSSWFMRATRAISAWLYRRSDRLLASSRSFCPRLEALGVDIHRIGYLPQWAEDLFSESLASAQTEPFHWEQGFVVMFAGNIGRVQGLDTVLAAAQLLKDDSEIRWVFLGDGSHRGWFEAEVARHGLEERIIFLGRQPPEAMPTYFSRAGAMLVSLMRDEVMSLTVPAKLQAYLAAGRPILGSIDGEAARIIEDSGSGWAAPAGDAHALAANVLRMKALSPAQRAEMGRLGQAFSKLYFARDRCLDKLEEELLAAVRGSNSI